MDGLGPDEFFESARRKSCERKTHQLCAEVERTLAFLLAAESADACLHSLYVEVVEPAPNASRLLVVLRPWSPAASRDLKAVLISLGEIKGYWRSQIAAAINRKKVPDLVFQVLLGEARRDPRC
jgi:ribosome-binding factor A